MIDLEKAKARNKKQNEYIKNKYDRLSIVLQKGTKDRISAMGYNVNTFVREAIESRLKALEEAQKSEKF